MRKGDLVRITADNDSLRGKIFLVVNVTSDEAYYQIADMNRGVELWYQHDEVETVEAQDEAR